MFKQTLINPVASFLPVSDHEEKIWMLQLQQPEQVLRHIGVWQMSENVDFSLLTQSIQNIIEEMPDLNVRYNFSNEGDLNKYNDGQSDCCLNSLQLNSEELPDYLTKLKDMPWDASINPPFNSFIIKTESDALLILDVHPILDERHQIDGLASAIQSQYNQLATEGEPLVLTKTEQLSTGQTSTETTSDNGSIDKSKLINIILEEFRLALDEPEMTAEEDFFDYGGHSLLATRIIGRLMQTHGIEISFNNFFKSPSAVALAEYAVVDNANLPTSDTQQKASVDMSEQKEAPLTLAQAFLWKAYSAYDFSPIYNLPFAFKFSDEVDETIFLKAFTDIITRHAGLRTLFHTQEGVTTQSILPITDLPQYKWFWNSDESQGVTLSDEATYQFDLSSELPLRVRFIRKSKSEPQVLSLLVHHMIIDEWSLNTIMADLSQAYMSRSNNQAPHWDTPTHTINEFALLQQKEGINQAHIDYWTTMLQGATKGLKLPNPNRQKEEPQEISTKAKWTALDLGVDAFDNLTTVARQHGSSLFNVIYTAIALALYKQGDLEEVVIGTSASGRTDPDFFDTVGYFTTMVAHRVQFAGEQSVDELLQAITYTINDSMSYADIPIDIIQKELGMTAEDGLLFDVYIHIHSNNALNGTLKVADERKISYKQVPPEKNDSMFGLHFEIMDDVLDGQHFLRLVVTYQENKYTQAQVDSICEKVSQILILLTSPCATNDKTIAHIEL